MNVGVEPKFWFVTAIKAVREHLKVLTISTRHSLSIGVVGGNAYSMKILDIRFSISVLIVIHVSIEVGSAIPNIFCKNVAVCRTRKINISDQS